MHVSGHFGLLQVSTVSVGSFAPIWFSIFAFDQVWRLEVALEIKDVVVIIFNIAFSNVVAIGGHC